MRYLTCIFFILSINCYSQELKKFEHWDDKYNNANNSEITKSKEFLDQHKLKLFEIYNCSNGIKSRFLDNLPYIVVKSSDTIIYLTPGGLFPTTREDFKENYLNRKDEWAYFIEGIRKDGRLGVITFYEYRFITKKEKLYYAFQTSKLNRNEENKLYDKLFESTSKEEQNKIEKEIKKNKYYKLELVFDFEAQKKSGDRITPEPNRYSQLIEISKTGPLEFYRFKTNITFFDLIDREFIIDKNFNFYLIEGHEIKK